MMNQAIDGTTVELPGPRENVIYLRVIEKHQFEALQKQQEIVVYAQ